MPECDNIGPGGIDIDQMAKEDTTLVGGLPVNTSALRLPHVIPAAASLSAAGV